MADDPDLSDDQFDRFLRCVAARFAGTQRHVKSRRACSFSYWYQAHAYRDFRVGNEQDAAELRGKLKSLVGAYVAARATVTERLAQESNDELADVGRTLSTVAGEILHELRPWLNDKTTPTSSDEAEVIERILQQIYSPDDNRRWQAYLFALNDELVPLDNIKSEKSRLGKIANECLAELRNPRHDE